ncbi:MAG: tRNA (adenosine(37)-N6)-dimethylallyltransferase MiaA [Anaerolineales bacterium]
MTPPPVVAIVGPTAVGKTSLSLALAQRFGGEIVSADSRQIYRGLDIGTAKATPAERATVPHHLLDIVPPDGELTLAHFRQLADEAIRDIWARGRVPLLVGGTGQWVWALLEGWTVPEVPPDWAFREALAQRAANEGAAALHAELAAVDPAAAARIDARNVRRVIRALEVHRATGQPISALQRREPPDYVTLIIGLTMPREALYARIDRRIEGMIAAGLVDEVRDLLAQGYDPALPSMSGLGYRQIIPYLRGESTLAEAVALLKRDTRRLVRQQANWFRLSDPRIAWYDVTTTEQTAIASRVAQFLSKEALR